MATAEAASPPISTRPEDPEINKLFRQQIKFNGSDLHLQTDKPAILRISGTLRELSMPPITEEVMYRMFYEMMDERNKQIFEANGGTDLAHKVPDEDGHPPRANLEHCAYAAGWPPVGSRRRAGSRLSGPRRAI